MSYLDVPRLHFAGTFRADPSTVNNVPSNYDPQVFNPNPSWNPNGTGQWQFLNCTVQSVVYTDGTICTESSEDSVIGSPVQGTDQPAVAKLVDLDPEQQMVSEIWGFHVQLGSASGPDSFVGDFEVAAFSDIWFRAMGGGGGDAPMGAFYQSVLTALKWSNVSNSRFLKELMKASSNQLSIKFNLDGINMNSSSPNFTLGRIVGTIGPVTKGEPKHFVLGRILRSAPGTSTDPNLQPMVLQGAPPASPMFFAPCRVDEKRMRVLLDLGNSISTTTPGGPVNPALGDLRFAILPPYAPPVLLGKVNYQETNWYKTTAGIQEFPITNEQLTQLAETPLGIVRINADETISQPLLEENSSGLYLRADSFVFRLNPGESAEVNLTATQFGRRAPKQKITLVQDSSSVDQMQSPPNPQNIPTGTPATALTFPSSVVTDKNGQAAFTLKASDPGNPRQFIDGQVYGVAYQLEARAATANYNHDPSNFISVLVFNSYPQPDQPTWKDVQPIFAQYAKLYPYMTTAVGINLASYADVKKNLSAIQQALMLPKSDPRYMQVTRDMSRDKLSLITRWIKAGAPPDPNSGPVAIILSWVNTNESSP
ncbi:MAG TPA: hypothetical protein VF708_17625 [Pyrinomonadaceae bacterium]|jgi:hypothetical protein